MRLLEALRLRVKDVEFERRELVVRDGKGAKDRVTVLPENLSLPLHTHMARVQQLHLRDLAAGFGDVGCPTRWRSSTPTPRASGAGSGCSRRPSARSTRAPAPSIATT